MNHLSIALYGGSFDPIHQGHIQIACFLQKFFAFSKFIFLPCGTPALKPSCQASNHDRLAMLKIALEEFPTFDIDTREFNRQIITYTIDTLKEYRQEFGPKVSLSFIIGHDAFANLMHWHHWQELLDYSHIIIHERPHQATSINLELKSYLKLHQTIHREDILEQAHGRIFCLFAGDFPISSSQIRKELQQHKVPLGLNPKVMAFIKKHQLYEKLYDHDKKNS